MVKRYNKPGRYQMSAASAPVTTFICWTGQRSRTNCSTISSSIPSIDSIEEFKIQKSMYPAEFGGKASALINVSTKAGSNAFHGSLFEFHRNDALDARNYFHPLANQASAATEPVRGCAWRPAGAKSVVLLRQLRADEAAPIADADILGATTAVRAGDFAGLRVRLRPAHHSCDGRLRAIANNQIPANRIDPLATAFLLNVPMPTSSAPVQNLASVEASTRALDQLSARVDHRLTDADQVFARSSTFDADELQPFGTSVLQESLTPGFGRTLTTKTRNRWPATRGCSAAAWLNELRVGWMSVSGGQLSQNRGNTFASQVGLLGNRQPPGRGLSANVDRRPLQCDG